MKSRMLNSDGADMMQSMTRRLALSLLLLSMPACSKPVSSAEPAKLKGVPHCTTGGRLTSQISAFAKEQQQVVESSPLYAIQASAASVSGCRISYKDKTMGLEYKFQDGGWFRLTLDPRIEYANREVRLASPLAEDPVAILKRAEHKVFGAKGCGIDWLKQETQPALDEKSAIETVFYGEVCNCQARIRRDADKRVIGLILRNTC